MQVSLSYIRHFIKVFLSPIATSQEILSEIKTDINIKRSNLDNVISKAMEDNRNLNINSIVVLRKRLELKDNYSNNVLVEIIIKLYIYIYIYI